MASQQHHQSEITAAVARTLGLGEDPDPVGVVCAVANEEQKGVMVCYFLRAMYDVVLTGY